MAISRREFIELLAAAGVSTLTSSWLVDRALALGVEGEIAVAPGPGIESWVRTVCGLCPGGCGLEVRRIDGLPVGLRGQGGHFVNRGRSCSLAHGGIQMLFGPDRVRRPLTRAGRRGQGSWTEVSWDAAEQLVAERVGRLLATGLPERIAFLDGRHDGLGHLVAEGFMHGLGSPHLVAARAGLADELARAMFGWERAPGADLENARVILLFRFDHLEVDGSPVWQSRVYGAARDRTIDRPIYVSVGPRLLGSAAKSDQWLPARPGTEAIVALAMGHVIIDEGWEDRGFLEKATDWLQNDRAAEREVSALLRAISPEVAAEMTGVARERIEQAAELFAKHRPGVALAGPGTPANASGRLLLWATNLLNVLLGSFGRRGGLVERPPPPLADVRNETAKTDRVAGRLPAISEPTQLAHALLTSEPVPIDVLFVRDANPAFDSPLARAFRQGLRPSDRMIVVFATELDETARLADVVFPEPTFLERWDVLTGTPVVPRAHATLQQPVIAPLFSARQSEEVLAHVANAVSAARGPVFRATRAEDLARLASEGLFADGHGGLDGATPPAGGSKGPPGFAAFWAGFQAGGVWAVSEERATPRAPAQRVTILPRRFFDPTGDLPVGGLQDAVRPRSAGAPGHYPYELALFATQQLQYGQTANLPMMMELAGHWAGAMWRTWVEIHPRTAAAVGVGQGDLVAVVSEFGHFQAVAHVSTATPPGLVAVPIGLGRECGSTAGGVGANPNLIVVSNLDDPAPAGIERVTRVKLVRV